MEQKIFETKRNDYIDLCASFSELLEKYKDYTPESATELEETITRACANSADIPGANKLFRLLKGYIQHRYNEGGVSETPGSFRKGVLWCITSAV